MVCIPVDTDQPLVAYRVTNELGLGISLDFTTMTEDDIADAVQKIFNDVSFYERIQRYSLISRHHMGYQNGAHLIIDYLNKKL